MKKILSLCLICVLLASTLVACNKDEIEMPPYTQLASDPSIVDFYLFVPDNWTVDMSTGTATAYYSVNDPTNICATLGQLTSTNKEDPYGAYFESFRKQFADVFGDPESVETATLLLDGHDARQYVYTSTFGGIEYKFWQVVCIRQGRVYTVTYSSTVDNYEKHAADMQEALGNFRFI